MYTQTSQAKISKKEGWKIASSWNLGKKCPHFLANPTLPSFLTSPYHSHNSLLRQNFSQRGQKPKGFDFPIRKKILENYQFSVFLFEESRQVGFGECWPSWNEQFFLKKEGRVEKYLIFVNLKRDLKIRFDG